MRDFWSDLLHAFRLQRKTPIASTVAVLALALGIGVNTSAFIPVEAVVVHPLPYRSLERIVTISESSRQRPAEVIPLTAGDFVDLHGSAQSFERIAAFQPAGFALATRGEVERVEGCRVSAQFFEVLGIAPLLGMTGPVNGSARAAVVSESFWRSRLAGASPRGAFLTLNGERTPIAGVMPDKFDFPLGTQVWLPFERDPGQWQDRSAHNVSVIGLLRAGVTSEASNRELDGLAKRLEEAYPLTNRGRLLSAVGIRDGLTEHVTNRFVIMLLGASTFVLLLACANVGNLQLARAALREKEISIRSALGATRGRIFRQLVTESVLMSLAAGLVGLLLANWDLAWGKSRMPAIAFHYVPGLRTMSIDGGVALFTLVVSLAAGLLCTVPAMIGLLGRTRTPESSEALRGKASAVITPGRNRLRNVLIIGELALSMVLLVGAGLMVKTFQRLLLLNQGFDPRNVMTLQVSLPTAGSPGQQSANSHAIQFYDRLLERLSTLPGASSAGLFAGAGDADKLEIEGRGELLPEDLRPEVTAASSGYFEAVRIGLSKGRSIRASDRPDSPPVVVVSDSVARYYWPDGGALGHKVRLGANSPWLTVVGVSKDIVEDWMTGIPAPEIYVPYTQMPPGSAEFVVRARGNPLGLAPSIRRSLASIDPRIPAFDVMTMERSLAEEKGGIRAAAEAMTTYAVVALILATTGIYAVVSYFVSARTHDIGIHIALGADGTDVLGMIMLRAVALTSIGMGVGLPLAFLLARGMSSMLYNIVTLTPITFGVLALILVASALVASYIPARRAMRIDPVIALRDE